MDRHDAELLNYSLLRLDRQIQEQEQRAARIPNPATRQTLRFIRDAFDAVDKAETRWRQAVFSSDRIDSKRIERVENDLFGDMDAIKAVRGEYMGEVGK